MHESPNRISRNDAVTAQMPSGPIDEAQGRPGGPAASLEVKIDAPAAFREQRRRHEATRSWGMWILSPNFQLAVQLAFGVFVVALFDFVTALRCLQRPGLAGFGRRIRCGDPCLGVVDPPRRLTAPRPPPPVARRWRGGCTTTTLYLVIMVNTSMDNHVGTRLNACASLLGPAW